MEGIYLGLGQCEDEVVTCLKHLEFPRLRVNGSSEILGSTGMFLHCVNMIQVSCLTSPPCARCTLVKGSGVWYPKHFQAMACPLPQSGI